jgi:phage-related protein
MREIEFYKKQSGKSPVEEFLNSLSGKQAQKVIWTLKLIEELETVPKQYFKKLTNTDDIWEVRVQLSGNIFRLLGFVEEEKLIILNHAFQKKTQKTPVKEIKLSEKRKKEYQDRK